MKIILIRDLSRDDRAKRGVNRVGLELKSQAYVISGVFLPGR